MKLTTTRKLTMWKKKLLPFAAVLVLSGVRTAGAVDYPTTILADNPIAYYRLEETSGTTAVDSSASGLFPGVYNFSGGYPVLGQPGIIRNSTSKLRFPSRFGLGRSAPTRLTTAVRLATFPAGALQPNPAGMFIRRRGRRAPLPALQRAVFGLPPQPLLCLTGITWSAPMMEPI